MNYCGKEQEIEDIFQFLSQTGKEENMDEDEVFEKFMSEFKPDKKYKGTIFFDWHHYITGSCLMGRESFVKNHGLDLEKEYTVEEFFGLCRNDYGGEVIRRLEKRWKNEYK